MKNFEQKLTEMNQRMAEIKKQYQAEAQVLFKDLFSEFFEQNSEVRAVGWQQYTPYFNDGEACIFSTTVDYAWATNTENTNDIRYGDYVGDDSDTVWVYDPNYGDFNEVAIPFSVSAEMQALTKILSKIDDKVYEDLFGDHVQVIVTRDGFDTVEFEHE